MPSPFDNCKECRFYGCGQANMPCRACCFGSKFEAALRRTTIPKFEMHLDVSKLLPTKKIVENIDKNSMIPNLMNEVVTYCERDVKTTMELADVMRRRVEEMKNRRYVPEIKRVYFNEPYTIVIWDDKTKTIVKTQGDEVYDPEKGLTMAICKKLYGNKGSYFDQISKWTNQYHEKKTNEEVAKNDIQKATTKIEEAMNAFAEAARKFAE